MRPVLRQPSPWLILALAVTLSAAAVLVVSPRVLTRGLPGEPAPAARAIDVGPAGEDVPTSSAITVAFKVPVDRQAVERGLGVEPALPGQVVWKGTTLVYRPEWPGLARGTSYTVRVPVPESLRTTVEGEEVTFRFTTAGKLAVQSAVPAPDAAEVANDGVVMVQFNRPVASLTTLRDAPSSQIVSFDPPVAGDGRWLTSTLYRFKPSQGFQPSTSYRAWVPRTISDTLGGALGEDYTWGFRTISPGVADTFPRDNTQYVGPSSEIKVTFNQPVHRAGAQSVFSLSAEGGSLVLGAFSWENDVTLVFRPSAPLERGRRYAAGIAAGGPAGIAKGVTWSFRTAPLPAVVSTTPQDGDQRARTGGVRMTFSTPMDRESVEAALQVEPKPGQAVHPRWDGSDTQMDLYFPQQPSSPYTVRIGSGAKDRFGAPLPPLTIRFLTAPRAASAYLVRSGPFLGTFDAHSTPKVLVRSVNAPQVTLTLYRLDREQLLDRLANAKSGDEAPAGAVQVRQWRQDLVAEPENVESVTSIELAAGGGTTLGSGAYLLTLSGGVPAQNLLFTISRTHLTVKQTETQVLVWATDLESGAPVANLPLTVHRLRPTREELATGTTDAQGVAGAPLHRGQSQPRPSKGYAGPDILAVIAEHGGDVAFGSPMLNGGISPWDFRLSVQYQSQPWNGFLYTDRPIYRPGQTVHFKGILRQDDDARYSLPPTQVPLTLRIQDPQGRVLETREIALSEYGTADGSLDLAEGAPVGRYLLYLAEPLEGDRWRAVGSGSFVVAAYRRPEFEVGVKPAQREVINGQAISVETSASYYFGAPVTDAALRWRSTSRDYSFQVPDAPGYSFSDFDRFEPRPQGQPRLSDTGRTDAAGLAAFSIPTSIDRDPLSQVYTIEATVADASNQEVSDRAEVIVHRGAYYIGLKPDRYVGVAGREEAVQVLTVDTRKQVMASLPVTVNVYRRVWTSVKQQDPGGEVRWRSQPQDTLVATVPLTTDREGRAAIRFTPEQGGAYRAVAEGRDGLGNTVRSATTLWVAGSDYVPWRIGNDDRIELVADRSEYRLGETARILVPSPFAGGTALITLERGKILRHEVRALTGNSTVLDIPITEDHLPNLYVSVALFKGRTAEGPPDLKLGYVELPVATETKHLTVGLAADQTRLRPQDTVTYTVTTRDAAGKPVAAEVSLALVDAAVLALTEASTPDPLAHFYRRRPLGVQTGDTQVVSLDRAYEQAADRLAGGKGGGGADAERDRSQFKDTAYWNASVRTDAQGRAQVSVQLPDNLTTWRLIAVGVTRDTLAGSATLDIVAAKPLLVRPATPRFLVAGDQVLLEAIVHNYTDRLAQGDIGLVARGFVGRSISLQTLNIAAGGSQKVGWRLAVARDAGEAVLTFAARSGDFSDRVSVTLPVKRFAVPETAGNAGTVRDAVREVVELPGYVDRDRGELTITVEPSLAAGMVTALGYLHEETYECTEATVSRFLPRLAAARAITKLGLPDPAGLRDDLPGLVTRSLQRLYAYQNQDGGWGWCHFDRSEATLTAYALLGLTQARRDGFAVDENVMQRASGHLRGVLDRPTDAQDPASPDVRAFVLYVLAAAGQGDLGRSTLLADQRDTLDTHGKALLVLALGALSQDGQHPGIPALISDLTSAAQVSSSGAHWEDERRNPRTMTTSTRTTALVLEALLRVSPEHPLVENGVRWLMVARKEGHWWSSYETAWSLLALADYLQTRGETRGAYAYLVAVNEREVGTGRVEGAAGLDAKRLTVAVRDLLLDEPNRVTISRTGSSGPLNYSMHLRYFPPAEVVESVSQGLSIAREYSLKDGDPDRSIHQARAGDVIRAKITVVASQDLHFVTVEDPFPAGLEPIDTSLKTTSRETQQQLDKERRGQRSEAFREQRPYWYFWGQAELRDDRLVLMARLLPKGVHEYTYFLQVTRPGEYRVLPVQAQEQYFPEVWGRSDGGTFTVSP